MTFDEYIEEFSKSARGATASGPGWTRSGHVGEWKGQRVFATCTSARGTIEVHPVESVELVEEDHDDE